MATPQDVFNSMMRNVRSKAQDLYNRADRDKSMSGFQFARGGLGNKINKVLQTPVSVPKPLYEGAKSAYGALTKLPSSQYVMGRGQESANRIIGGVEALQRPGIGNKALGGLSILSGGLSLTPAGQAREALVGVPLAGIRTGSQLLTGQQATPMENIRRGVTGYESAGSAVNPLTRKLLGEQGGDIASQALDIGNMALGMYKGGRYDPETKYLNTIRNLPENFTPRPGSILKKVDLTKPEMAARTRFESVAGPVFDVKKPIGKQDAKVVARIFEGAVNNKKVDPSEIADVKALGKKYLKGVNVARLSPEQIVTDLHKRANAPKMTEFMSKVDTPKLSVEPTGGKVKGEVGGSLASSGAEKKLSIMKTPSGKYQLVGSIPEELTVVRKNSMGQEFRDSPIFNTEAEAKAFISKTNKTPESVLPAEVLGLKPNSNYTTPNIKDVEKSINPQALKERGGKVISIEPSARGGEYWNVKFADGSEVMNTKLPSKPLSVEPVGGELNKKVTGSLYKGKTWGEFVTGLDKDILPTYKAPIEVDPRSKQSIGLGDTVTRFGSDNIGDLPTFLKNNPDSVVSVVIKDKGRTFRTELPKNIALEYANSKLSGIKPSTSRTPSGLIREQSPSPLGGKVGGEVSSPILSNDPGTRKGIRTGQEKVTDLLSKTKLEKPSKGGIPTRTKVSSEVSLESIIPKKGKLNLARLATDDVGKQALEDINRELPTSVITNKSVIEKAKTAKGSKGALSDAKMQEMIAQQLKNRQQVVDLSAKFSKAKADGASEQELAKIMLDLSNQSRVAQQGGTFAGRLLQAQNIIADQSASPMQKILALLDNAGVDQAKYTKDAIKVNWDNPTEVVTFYRKYVPSQLGEVLDEIRYTNMLSSPLTHIVNIASNALQSGVVAPVEKTITGLLDAARSSITGAERKYYASAGIDYTKGYLKSLPEAWTKAKNIMTQKEISLKPDMEFVPTGVGGPLQVYTTPLRALEAMDQFFRTLVKGGVTEELGKAPQKMTMARIAKSAEDEANYRLFRQSFDPNGELGQGTVLQFFDKWNSAISNLRRLPGGKWVLPFLQTPTNILKQGFEFSPLGVSTMVGAKNPIEQLSKAIIGTGVFATAYQLAQSGLTSWDAPTGQKERELYYAAGMQPYSIKIGDKWVSFSKLGPLAYPIAMAAALGDAERTKPDQTRLQAIGNSIGGMLGFFGDQSYVRSIGDLVESIQGGVSVGPNAIAGQAANFAGQMIPYRSFLTWMGRMIDPTYRKATTFTERLKKDLPIMGSQLEAYTDPSGKPSMRDLPFLNAVSPFKVSQEKEGVKLYDQYKEARIQRDIDKRISQGLEEGQSVGSGTTYQYMKDGSLKKIDIGKVSQMPEKTEFDKLKKKKESFKLVDDILDNLEPEQQAEALNKLGISSEDAQYYNIARQDNDLKYAYVQDQIAAIAKTSKNREDFLKFLVEGRKDINGQMIITNGVIDDLYDANLITAEEKKQLKNFEYDPTTQKYKLKSTGRGSGARLKQIEPIKRKIVLRSGKEFVNSIRAGSPLSQENLNKVQLGEGIRLKMPTL